MRTKKTPTRLRTVPRRRQRRRRTRRTYSLEYLLSRQPKSIRRHSNYPQLITTLRNSSLLRRIRIPSRCYTALNEAIVDPGTLTDFYHRYRLPQHPFFPMFLHVKGDYIRDRQKKAEERRTWIQSQVRSLPETPLAFLKYLGHFENHFNSSGHHPLWQSGLYPGTKKRAREIVCLSGIEWITLFRSHLGRLEERYPAFHPRTGQRLLACFVLEFVPESVPPVWPRSAEVKRRYRALSLQHHPDRGGNAAHFVELKEAYDTLLSK